MSNFQIGLSCIWLLLGAGSAVLVAFHVKAKPISWLWLAPLLIGGAVLGWWLSDLEYLAEDDLRIAGFPLPVAAFERIEDNRWRDYPGPPPFFIANLFIGLTSPLMPCAGAIAFARWVRKRSVGATGSPRAPGD